MADDELTTLRDDLGRLVRQLLRGAPSSAAVPFVQELTGHLGRDVAELPVVAEDIPAHRLADMDIAIAEVAAADPQARVIGVRGGPGRAHMSLSEMIGLSGFDETLAVGTVDYTNVPVGPDAERAVVSFGLHLLRYRGEPVVIGQRGAQPRYGQDSAQLEVISADHDLTTRLLADLRKRALARSVLRGQVINYSRNEYQRGSGDLSFVERPVVDAEDVILPDQVLTTISRHVVGMAEHRERLLAAGQHLKRGILLYGPPGTGKTHTVRHLIGASPDTTVVIMTGPALQYLNDATVIARAHQPAMIVLEDCDLIAEDRSMGHGPQPLLFALLDAMDGLDADADVVFLLTTNRADLLEPALAQRPGRVDLAVEIPLPDRTARRRLLDVYAGRLSFGADALDRVAARTDGTTASFAKELIRRATLTAAAADRDPTDADLQKAADDLLADAAALTRSLLGVPRLSP